MTTDKTIKSKYQPKQTNVTQIDLNGDTPVEKHFINGKWAEIGGSGRGSGSGCDCGGFKYNELPESAQFRNPTQEELNKYQDHPSLYKVLDLKDGIVPDKIIVDSEGGSAIFYLFVYLKDPENNEIHVKYFVPMKIQTISLEDVFIDDAGQLISISISSDGSLMLVDRTNHFS